VKTIAFIIYMKITKFNYSLNKKVRNMVKKILKNKYKLFHNYREGIFFMWFIYPNEVYFHIFNFVYFIWHRLLPMEPIEVLSIE